MTTTDRKPLFQPVQQNPNFPALEEQTLKWWAERQIFERSLEQTRQGPRYTFYEGPPTANGQPGVHHVQARSFKDLFPRFKTMQGYHVPRKAGWDTHGLPVEIGVEKKLGLNSKREVEAYGIDRVQRRVPAKRVRLRGRVAQVHRADGLLGRSGRRLHDAQQGLHRVGVVERGAASGQGPALQGLPGRAVLPQGRHHAEQRRGERGLQGHSGPQHLRDLRSDRAGKAGPGRRRGLSGVDDDALDAAVQRGRGDSPGLRVRGGQRQGRQGPDPGPQPAGAKCWARTPRW